jgi:hypothetical protein
MINIFEDNYFKGYEIRSLNNAQGQISGYSLYGEQVTTVFISHKHDDLAAL